MLDYRYDSKGSNDVKKGTYFRKVNFGGKVLDLPPSNHFPPGYVVSYSVTYIYTNELVFVIFPKVGNMIQKQSFPGVFQNKCSQNFSIFKILMISFDI